MVYRGYIYRQWTTIRSFIWSCIIFSNTHTQKLLLHSAAHINDKVMAKMDRFGQVSIILVPNNTPGLDVAFFACSIYLPVKIYLSCNMSMESEWNHLRRYNMQKCISGISCTREGTICTWLHCTTRTLRGHTFHFTFLLSNIIFRASFKQTWVFASLLLENFQWLLW